MILNLARTIADALRAEPFALALVVVNVMWLVWGSFTMREIGRAVERRDAMFADMAKACVVKQDDR